MTESQKAFEQHYLGYHNIANKDFSKTGGLYNLSYLHRDYEKWQAAEAYGRKQATVLPGLLDQPAITKMTIPPPQAEMADVVYAEGWNAACDAYFGGLPPQEPLIVTIENTVHLPATFTPITADMVTGEMVAVYGANFNSWDTPTYSEQIEAAVNAYLGSKK